MKQEFDFGFIEYLHLQAQNICRVVYTQNKLITKSSLIEINNLCIALSNQKPYYNLTIVNSKIASTDDAKEYALGHERAKDVLKDALVMSSHANSIIANFYFRIKKPVVPGKVFSNEADAIKWLLEPF